jgi:hypothetical protein
LSQAPPRNSRLAYAYIYTYTYTYIHTSIHISSVNIQTVVTNNCLKLHPGIYAYIHIHIYTYIHTYIHAYQCT